MEGPRVSPVGSGCLSLRARRLYCLQVRIEEHIGFVAFSLILLAHADDLADNLHIEAITFRLSVDFSFSLVQFVDLFLDLLDTLHDGS